MDKKRKQPLPVSFYLGKDERQRRIDALDRAAKALDFKDRSSLLQAIADGKVKLERSTA